MMFRKKVALLCAIGLCVGLTACAPIGGTTTTTTLTVATTTTTDAVLTTNTVQTTTTTETVQTTTTTTVAVTTTVTTSTSTTTATTTTVATTTTATQTAATAPPSQLPVRPIDEMFSKETFTTEDGYTLPYRLYVPENYTPDKQWPVFLYLHGAHARGNDNERMLDYVTLPFFQTAGSPTLDSIVVMPQCPADEKWVNVSWTEGNYFFSATPISKSMTAVIALLDDIESRFSTDLDRYYVMGMSMGGYGTWDICMRQPDRFAAIVPLCGAGDWRRAATISHVAIRTYHGTADDTVPINGTERMVEFLKKNNADVTFVKLQDVGHDLSGNVHCDKTLFPWLFAQKRKER